MWGWFLLIVYLVQLAAACGIFAALYVMAKSNGSARVDWVRFFPWLLVIGPLAIATLRMAEGLSNLFETVGTILLLVFLLAFSVMGYLIAEMPGFIVGTLFAMFLCVVGYRYRGGVRTWLKTKWHAVRSHAQRGPLAGASQTWLVWLMPPIVVDLPADGDVG